MRTETQTIPLTGQITFELDWTAFLADLSGTPTLSSAAWTLSADLTEVAATTSGDVATLTLSTSGLTQGTSHSAICAATLSDGQILQAQVPMVANYLSVRAQ